ncbi:hypothetical protein [Dyadobacter sp. 3J3]|uniref:hypothetical protein n=1 Tax=Dyadobacter sp. 3J3 TaxID=2606600 RepID=UPI00135AE49B|nr:hypothetical protein [Dyadobacter sp. 3J3]
MRNKEKKDLKEMIQVFFGEFESEANSTPEDAVHCMFVDSLLDQVDDVNSFELSNRVRAFDHLKKLFRDLREYVKE